MIVGYVVGQALTIDTPVIASDSVNYIEARFVFLNRDWDGLAIHAIFDDGDVAYACPLKDGRVAQDNGLNLGAGTWRVHLVGSAMDGDVLVRRITTNPAKIEVVCAGRMDGEPVPPARYTDIEEIEAALTKKIDAPQVAQVGEVLTVEAVDTDGKPTKWKTAPAAAEQKQADWAQNDPTKPDYILNRPGGYYGELVTVDEAIYSGEIEQAQSEILVDWLLVAGQTYKVTIGEVTKTYTAFADSFRLFPGVTIGDGTIEDAAKSGEMFALFTAENKGNKAAMLACPVADVGKTIRVTTETQKREVHKIPTELLDLGGVDESINQTNAALDALYGQHTSDISAINKILTEGPIVLKKRDTTITLGKDTAGNGYRLQWDMDDGSIAYVNRNGLYVNNVTEKTGISMSDRTISIVERVHNSGIRFNLAKSVDDPNGGTRFSVENVAGDRTTFYASGKIINSNRLLQLSASSTITEDNATTLRGVKTPEQEYDAANKKYVDQRLPSPATAQIGQIVKVKSVDESGKITETETVDMPTIPQPFYINYMIATEQIGENEFGYTLRPIPTINDFIDLGITAAQVGQIIKVKAVDDFGNPLEWEAVDMPTQKTLKWVTVYSSDLAETKRELIISTDTDGKSIADYNPVGLTLIISTPADATQTDNNGAPWVYPSATKKDNAIRVIGSIAGWKTTARDSVFAFYGGSSAMTCTGNGNIQLATYKIDGYALDGVTAMLNGNTNHFPVGTHVEVSILCEVAE